MPKRPTILQVLPAMTSGGVERGTVEISLAIVRAGWKSLVASSGGPMVTGVSYTGGEHINLPLESKNPWVMYQNYHALVEVIKRHDVSIIHARSRAPAWSAYYAAKKTGIPFVTTFHGVYGLESDWKRRYNSIMVKGDRVIAVSNYIRDHILKEYECDPSKITVIHRGADLAVFHPDNIAKGQLEILTKAWRLPEEPAPIILMPGRFSRWKGHEVLIKALAKLPNQHFLCIMMGDSTNHPDYTEELKKLVIREKLEGRVRFAPNSKYMSEAYTLAEVVVVPSIEPEAFGRVPVEAQAMGKIVVTTNHGGAMETVVEGETGFLVEPNNVDAMARALQLVMEMGKDRKLEMEQAAINHVWEHFSADLMRQKTLDVYQSLL